MHMDIREGKGLLRYHSKTVSQMHVILLRATSVHLANRMHINHTYFSRVPDKNINRQKKLGHRIQEYSPIYVSVCRRKSSIDST